MLPIFGTIGQTVNFCILSHLHANVPNIEGKNKALQSLEVWIFAENFMMVFIFISVTLFLFVRSCDRCRIHMEFGDSIIKKVDYLFSEDTNAMLKICVSIMCFIGTNYMLLHHGSIQNVTSIQSWEILKF